MCVMVFYLPGTAPFINRTYHGNYGGGRLHMDEEAKIWKQGAISVLQNAMHKNKWETLTVACGVRVYLTRPDRRSDLLASEKIILDVLQHAGVYRNDNLVDEFYCKRTFIKDKADISIEVYPLDN